MSQFRPRFQPPSPRSQNRDAEVKLRMNRDAYSSENADSPYTRRQAETQNIKKLSFWHNADHEGKEEDEWAERQSPTPFILAMIILVVASTLLWFLFRWASGENTNSPPIIAADTTPFKVRPENPGGMMIPHQDKLIYGRLSQDTPQPIERLLPLPEQPMAATPHPMSAPQIAAPPGTPPGAPPMMGTPMNAPPMSAPAMAPQPSQVGTPQIAAPQNGAQQGTPPYQQHPYPQGQGYAPIPQPYSPNPSQQQGVPPQPHPHFQPQPQPQSQYPQGYPPAHGQAPFPHQQQPLQGQPSYPQGPQGSAPNPTAGQPAIPQVPLKAASNPIPPKQLSPVESIKPATDDEDADDNSISEGQSELDQLIAREAETPLKRPTKTKEKNPIKPLAIDPGKHKVQIASLPSQAMAEQEMKRLRSHHGSVFQNKPWNIQRINLGPDRGFTHRLVVGSFSNHAAAANFCKKLRTAKIRCQVIAPAKE